MKLTEIAWLAGILEGEGYFGWNHNSLTVQLNMTDLDIVKRAYDLMGCKGVMATRVRPGCKDCYRIRASGSTAAAVMMTIYSFMGERRRSVIYQCLLYWKAKTIRGKFAASCLNGHLYTEESTLIGKKGQRICRTCSRIATRKHKETSINVSTL